MKRNDALGFTETIPEPILRSDPIGQELNHPGYIANYDLDGVRFQRFYWNIKLVFEKDLKTLEEKDTKKKFCKKRGLKYVGLMQGEHITARELHQEIKKQGGKSNGNGNLGNT